MPKRINWKLVASNLAEAREQLEQLEVQLKASRSRSAEHLQVGLEHALHHIYFAWNVRHTTTAAYVSMTDRDFTRWSKMPTELEVSHIEPNQEKA